MRLEGQVASPGITLGSAVLFNPNDFHVDDESVQDVVSEVTRVREAVYSAIGELERLRAKVCAGMGADFASIFRSQQTIAEDETILTEVVEAIETYHLTAESAVRRVFDRYVMQFAALSDGDYIKTRAADVEDVAKRIRRILLGLPVVNLSDLPRETILVARELYPSDTVMLDTARVVGIITERGGSSSHVAILAKNLEIPAAVGVERALDRIHARDTVVLDSSHREKAWVLVNPREESLQKIEARRDRLRMRAKLIDKSRQLPPITRDNVSFSLSANVGSTLELDRARAAGARSIGLYRSEFLFLGAARLPDEETQFIAYRTAAETFSDGFVVIRTLDIGGDKTIPAITKPHEDNPFLGNRALRLCLAHPEMFRTQLRAILRASAYGTVKILFPMIGGIPELEQAQALLESVRRDLCHEQIAFDPDIETGIMVEVPSAVWVADALARRVDFFSIGTNDLTQYLLAADRLNSSVASYFRTFDPSVFRAISHVVEAAHHHDRWVGVCGELGGDPRAIPALIGAGIKELSMSPGLLAEANWVIRGMTMEEARKLTRTVLELDSHDAILEVLNTVYRARIEALEGESVHEKR